MLAMEPARRQPSPTSSGVRPTFSFASAAPRIRDWIGSSSSKKPQSPAAGTPSTSATRKTDQWAQWTQLCRRGPPGSGGWWPGPSVPSENSYSAARQVGARRGLHDPGDEGDVLAGGRDDADARGCGGHNGAQYTAATDTRLSEGRSLIGKMERMGTFFHPTTITGRDGEETVEALVDTGADFTTMPGSLLRRLGVKPFRQAQMRLADGSSAVWDLGRVTARLDGQEEATICVFGAEEAPPTIGAYTLEGLLLGVEPCAPPPGAARGFS